MEEDEDYESVYVDVKKLIELVKERPVVWNKPKNHGTYNKVLLEDRFEAWTQICRSYDDTYDIKSHAERRYLETLLKRKWRSLRDCYARELRLMLRQQSSTSGGKYRRKRRRKPYIYFKDLSFMGNTLTEECKARFLEGELDEDTFYMDDHEEQFSKESGENILQTLMDDGERTESEGEHIVVEQITSLPQRRKRKALSDGIEVQTFLGEYTTRARSDTLSKYTANPQEFISLQTDTNNPEEGPVDVKPLHFLDMDSRPSNSSNFQQPLEHERQETVISARSLAMCRELELDEDRMFMLSMVPDMKCVSKEWKLELKSEILNVIMKYVKKSNTGEPKV